MCTCPTKVWPLRNRHHGSRTPTKVAHVECMIMCTVGENNSIPTNYSVAVMVSHQLIRTLCKR